MPTSQIHLGIILKHLTVPVHLINHRSSRSTLFRLAGCVRTWPIRNQEQLARLGLRDFLKHAPSEIRAVEEDQSDRRVKTQLKLS